MSLVHVLLAAALAALVALHMARPRFRRRRLSAARFFRDLPPADDARRRFRPGNPLRSRPLYPQLLLLGCLAAALLAAHGCERKDEERLGVRIFVDTSYSMSALQEGGTRLDAARREVRRFLAAAAEVGTSPPCFRLDAFDMEVRPLAPEPVDRAGLEALLAGLEARPLGTDLGLLREPLAAGEDDPCPARVRLAVSDLPAPDWAGETEGGWIWRDVGRPVANAGLASIEALRDPFGGRVDAVAVELAAYGPPPEGARLAVLDSGGRPVESHEVEWNGGGLRRLELALPGPGLYRLRLAPGGAYAGDDEAVIDVPAGSRLRVDWRLPSRQWADRFGWLRASGDTDLVVLPPGEDPPEAPALVVGDHYRRGPAGEIGFFVPDSPLTDGLSFDVAEEARILGIVAPRGFEPVLAGPNLGRDVWVARRDQPRGVYVPGLPTGGDDPLGRFSATLFVQSLRWLLRSTPPPPLYTLTSPAHPRPAGSRIALHQGEGKTDHQPLSRGDVDELRGAVRTRASSPSWPWWVAAAAGVFLVEQALLGWAGESWR